MLLNDVLWLQAYPTIPRAFSLHKFLSIDMYVFAIDNV